MRLRRQSRQSRARRLRPLAACLLAALLAVAPPAALADVETVRLTYDLDLGSVPAELRTPEKVTDPAVAILKLRLESLKLEKQVTVARAGDFRIVVEVPSALAGPATLSEIKKGLGAEGRLVFRVPPGKDGAPGDELAGTIVASVEATRDAFEAPAIAFEVRADAQDRLERLTRDNVGRQVEIVLDGAVLSAPFIRAAIREKGIITGHFTREEVDRLVAVLRGPPLPCPIVLAGEELVSPAGAPK